MTVTEVSAEQQVAVQFYLPPDTGLLELHYRPPSALERCRSLAAKIGEVLGYELESSTDRNNEGTDRLNC